MDGGGKAIFKELSTNSLELVLSETAEESTNLTNQKKKNAS